MKEALAWAIGLTGAAAVTATAAYALTGGGQSATPPAQAKATPPPPPTTTPTTPVTVQPTPTPSTPAPTPNLPIVPVIIPTPTPAPTPAPSTPSGPSAPSHTEPLPAKPNTTSITLAPGTITAPQVGIAGSVLIIYVNEQGSVANQFSPLAPTVDGVQQQSLTVADNTPFSPVAGTAFYAQSGSSVSVVTTRNDGTIIVLWLDGNGAVQTTFINYGTPPEYPTMMTTVVPTATAPSAPNETPGSPSAPSSVSGTSASIGGVGLSGSKVIVDPAAINMTILSPIVVDGQQMDLASIAPGKSQSVLVPNWSGAIEVYWTTGNIPPSAPGSAPINVTQPQPPGQQITFQKSTIYYGA